MHVMTGLLPLFRMWTRLLSEFDTEETDWKKYWSACETLFQDATGLTFREMTMPTSLKSSS